MRRIQALELKLVDFCYFFFKMAYFLILKNCLMVVVHAFNYSIQKAEAT